MGRRNRLLIVGRSVGLAHSHATEPESRYLRPLAQ
jgi:hypothetical protein